MCQILDIIASHMPSSILVRQTKWKWQWPLLQRKEIAYHDRRRISSKQYERRTSKFVAKSRSHNPNHNRKIPKKQVLCVSVCVGCRKLKGNVLHSTHTHTHNLNGIVYVHSTQTSRNGWTKIDVKSLSTRR